MSHNVALLFEDGITRFVLTNPGETIADAAYRARINIPVDCRDGACGTCKSFCEFGSFDPGSYIEEALSDDEAAEGYCLPCQMRPTTDCAIRIPASSSACKIERSVVNGTVLAAPALSPSTFGLSIQLDDPAALAFLPGQYVNLSIPGSGKTRAYSFCSAPGSSMAELLIRNIPGGAMSTWLSEVAQPGDRLTLEGPFGSFYLRASTRPIVMLAGGTGLAPFLSMLAHMQATGAAANVHLVYGVTNDADLVHLDDLDHLAATLPSFTYLTCVASPASAHAHKGFVTHHLPLDMLQATQADVYLCGPPPMVEAVREKLRELELVPASFHYEKFAPSEAAPR